ncbi:MAG: hypothetical protein OEV01_07270 [Nitrospira sp.]|nr:hypothetical protein [Nitrospira sp.]MDH5192481.1 hypothetical protein [Nitrospira sp.]
MARILSGSYTSVNGQAASVSLVVATQILSLGSFQAFLTAGILAGAI